MKALRAQLWRPIYAQLGGRVLAVSFSRTSQKRGSAVQQAASRVFLQARSRTAF
jgi:hypothetical protein